MQQLEQHERLRDEEAQILATPRSAHRGGGQRPPHGDLMRSGIKAVPRPRVATPTIGAVRRPLLGLSVPIMGRVCQRESDNGETGAMVCRRRVTMAGSQQSIGSHRRGRRR